MDRSPNLALVGTHGLPEITGLLLSMSALEYPIDRWDIEVVNKVAIIEGYRFVRFNMATTWNKGDPNSNDYELRRTVEILELAEDRELVLDVHDQPINGGEFIVIGESKNKKLLGVAALLGTKKVIIAPEEELLVNHNPNAATIELGRGKESQLALSNMTRLRKCMGFVAINGLPVVNPASFDYYERVIEIPTSTAKALLLSSEGHLEPFDTIPPETLEILKESMPDGLPPSEYVAEYWDWDSSNPEWFGGVLRRLPFPF
jgi:hypothetical protein